MGRDASKRPTKYPTIIKPAFGKVVKYKFPKKIKILKISSNDSTVKADSSKGDLHRSRDGYSTRSIEWEKWKSF
jgi:hypothetical protein